jgi:dipeptidyl-peptidase-4
MNFYKFLLVSIIMSLSMTINSQSTITVDKIWKDYKYIPNRVPGFNFMKDGRHYTRLENNTIVKYDLTTGEKVEDLVSGDNMDKSSGFSGKIGSYEFNEDESLIVIKSESEPIYRRSTKAYFHIYNRKDNSLQAVNEDDKISYATLSPDANKIAYVWKNDIYYMNLKDGITLPVTSDGKKNHIINGSADWVYEEEFSFAKAFFWGPDSKQIAYQRFDETEVPEFTMTNYRNELYPEYVTFKYPKVGEKNAIVSAHIYHLDNSKTINVSINDSNEFYIPRLHWTQDNNKLFIYKMNRHQNQLDILSANSKTGKVDIIMTEKNEYYIDITDDIRFLKNGKEFIWSSEKSGFNHLYLHKISGEEIRPLTEGDFDVTSFFGYDEDSECLFYQAAENSPLERQIYQINIKGNKKKAIVSAKGTNNAQFSSTFEYYINTYSNINTPATYTVFNKKHKIVRVIEDNQGLKRIQNEEKVENMEFFDFTTSEGTSLNGWLLKPANFDENGQYPVFMYLYGGPGSQQVTDNWKGQNYWWFQMLAQHGYVVACVDNRGTGGRGEKFKKMTYLQLGHYETIDQIEAAKYLGALKYTDKSRIGIFGWSYGGYMSSLCLFKGNNVFKSAIAVAPVTNWKWYDSVYTERYMRTEKENPDGYAKNSPVNFTDKLKGNYLLIHGMGDDNVHFQNSVEMANALIAANKQFDTYYYPNRHHGISGGGARLHLYDKMTNFLMEKL